MKLLILFLFMIPFLSEGTLERGFGGDQLEVGKKTSTDDKIFILNDGAGGSRFQVVASTGQVDFVTPLPMQISCGTENFTIEASVIFLVETNGSGFAVVSTPRHSAGGSDNTDGHVVESGRINNGYGTTGTMVNRSGEVRDGGGDPANLSTTGSYVAESGRCRNTVVSGALCDTGSVFFRSGEVQSPAVGNSGDATYGSGPATVNSGNVNIIPGGAGGTVGKVTISNNGGQTIDIVGTTEFTGDVFIDAGFGLVLQDPTNNNQLFLFARDPLAAGFNLLMPPDAGLLDQCAKSDGTGFVWGDCLSDLDAAIKVSANDTTQGYLNGKLVAGAGISFVENNDGGDETLTLNVTGSGISTGDAITGATATAFLYADGSGDLQSVPGVIYNGDVEFTNADLEISAGSVEVVGGAPSGRGAVRLTPGGGTQNRYDIESISDGDFAISYVSGDEIFRYDFANQQTKLIADWVILDGQVTGGGSDEMTLDLITNSRTYRIENNSADDFFIEDLTGNITILYYNEGNGTLLTEANQIIIQNPNNGDPIISMIDANGDDYEIRGVAGDFRVRNTTAAFTFIFYDESSGAQIINAPNDVIVDAVADDLFLRAGDDISIKSDASAFTWTWEGSASRSLLVSGADSTVTVMRVDNSTTNASPVTMIDLDFSNDDNCVNGLFMLFSDSDGIIGSIQCHGNGFQVIYNVSSDERLKEHISGIPDAIGRVMSLPVHKYKWKSGDYIDEGFFAQEAYEVIPYAVTVGGDDPATAPWQMDYSRTTPVLWAATQEQQLIIEDLRAEINELKATVQSLIEAQQQ